jgi:hypothetical protein
MYTELFLVAKDATAPGGHRRSELLFVGCGKRPPTAPAHPKSLVGETPTPTKPAERSEAACLGSEARAAIGLPGSARRIHRPRGQLGQALAGDDQATEGEGRQASRDVERPLVLAERAAGDPVIAGEACGDAVAVADDRDQLDGETQRLGRVQEVDGWVDDVVVEVASRADYL